MMPVSRIPAGDVKRVIVLCIGRLGDLIVATPLLAALRARLPQARIALLTGERGEDAARLITDADERLCVRRWTSPLSNLALAWRLLSGRDDLLLDLNPAFSRTAWLLAKLSRCRFKLTFKKGRGNAAYTHHIHPPGEAEHMLARYRRLADALGASYEPRLRVSIPEGEDAAARDALAAHGLDGGGLLVGVFPGNFKKFDNRWPRRKFAELLKKASAAEGVKCFLLLGPGEEAKAQRILSKMGRSLPVVGPLSLARTAALLRRIDLLVTNATGTAHLAVAVGTPTFSILGGYTKAVWMYPAPGQEALSGSGFPRHFSVASPSWSSCRDVRVEDAWTGLQQALDYCRSRKGAAA
ncbi:MAG TPA: hypothetical protein DCM05_14875 [Elusimicrobia bacterium]|nr:hypothetical protein [Elusimicrobiota bacterium]